MGPAQHNAEASTRACASAQCRAGPTLERGNDDRGPDTRAFPRSHSPPVRPRRRRSPRDPFRLHDRRHRSRAGDGGLAPGALPRQHRDQAGNLTLTLGRGSPKRLFTCPLDEVGYVVGNILPDGFLLLRRVGGAGRTASPLFDQQLEGHRVTVFGARGAVPGVVAVKSTHLTRGRSAPGTPDPVFTVDNAYVDVGATSAADAQGLGIAVLAPVSLAKRPQLYGERLLAAPVAGRRAACAALAAAVQAKPKVKGTVVVAFTVQSLYTSNAGLASVKALLGPFDDIKTAALPARYADTAVETVALADADRLVREILQWMEGR